MLSCHIIILSIFYYMQRIPLIVIVDTVMGWTQYFFFYFILFCTMLFSIRITWIPFNQKYIINWCMVQIK